MWIRGDELVDPLEAVLAEPGGVTTVCERVAAALEERRDLLDEHELATLDVIEALTYVLPPVPGSSFFLPDSAYAKRTRADLLELRREARRVCRTYSIREKSKFGAVLIAIVRNVACLVLPRLALPKPRPTAPKALPASPALKPPRPPPPPPRLWPPGATDSIDGVHAVFARLVADRISVAAAHLPELGLSNARVLEAKLRARTKLARRIESDDFKKLALEVLRAAGIARPHDIISAAPAGRARRRKQRRAAAGNKDRMDR